MKEPNWERVFEKLLDKTRKSIFQFRKENPDVVISDFWFDSEPCYGYVLISINSLESAQRLAKEQYEYHVNYRRKLLSDKLDVWLDNAYYQIGTHSVSQICTNSGDFDFQQFAEIKFPEWQNYAESSDYPLRPDKRPDHLDDYLESRVSYTFWRVYETLVEENAFLELNLASPTRLGFAFHDGSEYILYLLNWKDLHRTIGFT